ncbi:NAD(P)H:quinone oxidoreductase [Aggregicoccus sp. 17bor-14]|uniref:NAD(P)H:quinone oxidoreductase n=1 Tax=Myxococcaceae TaxID=31 RepID=UPI00129CE33B|nr:MULTISPECIES: NAD(P)H:quinone oxidoreductase [Myxococcaceae]MBF5045327.1 NAD(P)H:quinone oxidoreductase [Simulacricoccus sp. 17bor-14]MRI91069.1 NAD(P)H:quinone oxidoreductase [Aggregicoccus sp. 17bor-14]
MAKVKLAVIYYSATGVTYQQALAVEEGAKAAGAEVRLRKVKELAPDQAIQSNQGWSKHRTETQHVPEATNDDLTWADAIIFGTPTRYGLPSAQLKQFIDGTGGLWAKGALVNKVMSSFTSTATKHGGQETTLVALNNVFYHWGAIIVAPGYVDPIQFEAGNPYGASHVSANGTIPPDETAKKAARFQARRVVEVTAQLLAGRSAQT